MKWTLIIKSILYNENEFLEVFCWMERWYQPICTAASLTLWLKMCFCCSVSLVVSLHCSIFAPFDYLFNGTKSNDVHVYWLLAWGSVWHTVAFSYFQYMIFHYFNFRIHTRPGNEILYSVFVFILRFVIIMIEIDKLFNPMCLTFPYINSYFRCNMKD